MKLKDYRYTGKRPFVMEDAQTDAPDAAKNMKDELLERTRENYERMADLQDMLYADGREGLIVVLQAMDAAGKDSTIRHVMSGLNPQGVDVYSFKAPNSAELSHDYLWRVTRCLPPHGKIAIFNRSHYEDILAVDVLKLYKGFKLPERCLGDDFIEKRTRQIAQYEEYLYDNGLRTVKIFLNISKTEQKKRFLERLNRPEKNWKFEGADLSTRELWDEYHASYERAINATATKHSPWYVLPADDKWFTRYLVSEIVVEALEKIDPCYPELSDEEKARLPEYTQALQDEK